MRYRNIKHLLNVLLIIALVVQPVMFTYAMASMSHGHHVSMAMSYDMNTHHAMQIDDTSSSSVLLDDCCKTPACSPAVLTSSLDIQHIPAVHHDISFNVSMMSVDLPSENKPPRH